jgi:cytidylate kinase
VTCSVVCISRTKGAGGEEVAQLVAQRLGFVYVDDEIVARAAARGGISPAEVADEERRKSLVARVLEAMAHGGAELAGGGIPLSADEMLTSDDVRALIRETIEQTVARGNAVIVAHAASHVVAQTQGVVRVLVTASPATRATRVSAAEGLDQAQAARAVKDSDAARSDYLKRFYGISEELPIQYDLVVNTDVLSFEQAAGLVAGAASS